jgi:competence transcription factor ComK
VGVKPCIGKGGANFLWEHQSHVKELSCMHIETTEVEFKNEQLGWGFWA